MNRQTYLFVRTAAAMAVLIGGTCRADNEADLRAKIDAYVQPLLKNECVVGLAIGVIDGEKTFDLGYGKVATAETKVPDNDTIYEIGSISKTFTGILLADLVKRKLVSLDDPAGKYLPDRVKLPRKLDAEITLRDLATHTSGLPRMPDNFKPKDPLNPYDDYAVDRLYEFLNAKAKPGFFDAIKKAVSGPQEIKSEYSNLGFGLLGHIVERRAETTYAKLLDERICQPLKMDDTCIALNAAQETRLAPPYDSDGNPGYSWTWTTSSLAGAGGIRSTVRDMLEFARANMGLSTSELSAALELSHQPAFKVNDKGSIGLGWQINTDKNVIWHNGQTGSYHTILAFDKARKHGVVVLSNSPVGEVDAVGFAVLRMLRGETPPPIAVRATVPVKPEVLEEYVGKFMLAPLAIFTITREGDKLYAQLTGQDKYRIRPESETKFFYRVVDAQITFKRDDKGKVSSLILHQNGRDQPAMRMPGTIPAADKS